MEPDSAGLKVKEARLIPSLLRLYLFFQHTDRSFLTVVLVKEKTSCCLVKNIYIEYQVPNGETLIGKVFSCLDASSFKICLIL